MRRYGESTHAFDTCVIGLSDPASVLKFQNPIPMVLSTSVESRMDMKNLSPYVKTINMPFA